MSSSKKYLQVFLQRCLWLKCSNLLIVFFIHHFPPLLSIFLTLHPSPCWKVVHISISFFQTPIVLYSGRWSCPGYLNEINLSIFFPFSIPFGFGFWPHSIAYNVLNLYSNRCQIPTPVSLQSSHVFFSFHDIFFIFCHTELLYLSISSYFCGDFIHYYAEEES